MSISSNTRIWKGSTLSVRNSGDSAWIAIANVIDHNMPSTAPNRIAASTAASTIDKFRLGLPDNGTATFNVFDYMDDTFLDEMNDMQDAGATRTFKLVMPEGTRNTRVFTAYVQQQPITGNYNDLWKMALTLKVVKDYWWIYPIPTVTARTPTSGAAAGGTTVTLTGTNFEDGLTSVIIGGITIAADDVTVVSSTSLTFVTPAHAAAAVTIAVATPSGTSGTVAFTYT